jgi:hypothetical protein
MSLIMFEKGGLVMGAKSNRRYEEDDVSHEGFYLYDEVFDEENVYLRLQGFQFEVSTSREFSGNGVPIVTVKLPRLKAMPYSLSIFRRSPLCPKSPSKLRRENMDALSSH